MAGKIRKSAATRRSRADPNRKPRPQSGLEATESEVMAAMERVNRLEHDAAAMQERINLLEEASAEHGEGINQLKLDHAPFAKLDQRVKALEDKPDPVVVDKDGEVVPVPLMTIAAAFLVHDLVAGAVIFGAFWFARGAGWI